MYAYDIDISADFILYLATFIAGISIVYAIKKWFLSSYLKTNIAEKSPKVLNDVKKNDLNFNDNHYPNGNTKLKDNTINISINNNESEECEESDLIKCKIIQTLENELTLGSGESDFEPKVISEDLITATKVTESLTSKEEPNKTKNGKTFPNVSDLAAIVLTDSNNSEWSETICITSGSDIINPHNLEPEFVVVDCRAPVLARRCLIRYLYAKLNEVIRHKVEEDVSLFTSIAGSNRFQLKENYKINLYLNRPPDSYKSNEVVNGPKKRSPKLIRLKSATDKISLWNQVGIQGSLLTHFIDTIYINSINIPVEFNEKSIHQHFVLNYTKEPKVLKCQNIFRDINDKINRVCVNGCTKVATNWIQTEDSVEIIDCETGKAIREDNTNEHFISRLSKHELNKSFRDFLANYEHNLRPHQTLPLTYRKWKESAPNYRIQKQLLKVRYAVAGRPWNTVPSDLDMFI